MISLAILNATYHLFTSATLKIALLIPKKNSASSDTSAQKAEER